MIPEIFQKKWQRANTKHKKFKALYQLSRHLRAHGNPSSWKELQVLEKSLTKSEALEYSRWYFARINKSLGYDC